MRLGCAALFGHVFSRRTLLSLVAVFVLLRRRILFAPLLFFVRRGGVDGVRALWGLFCFSRVRVCACAPLLSSLALAPFSVVCYYEYLPCTMCV